MRRLLMITALVLAGPLWAVEPDEVLDDPALEARARVISAQVRCVVCQNEPIDTSNAGVARDLRLLIRERLMAGDSNEEVYDFLVARYGEYVLFKPPFKPATYALWFGPFVILGFGALAVFVALSRRRGQVAAVQLTPAEEARIARLMDDKDNPG